jgi:hypothetical protein
VHQDYILRMMQQISLFITGVFRLRKDGDLAAAHDEVLSGYGHLTGLPSSLVHGLSEDDLLTLLSARGAMPVDRCIGLAELLREEGEILLAQDREDDAWPRLVKALRFYLEALAGEGDLRSADIPGLDEVVALVSWHPVGDGTRSLLLPYLEATGQYDKLENVLNAWMDTEDPDAQVAATATYQRLLAKSDAELIVGGLTRSEVEHAILELRGAEHYPVNG